MPTKDPFKGLAAEGDEFDVVHQAVMTDGELVRYDATRLKDDVRHQEKEREDKCTDEPVFKPVDHQDPTSKIHPLLTEWIKKRDGGEIDTVVVTFRDDLVMPRFPEPDIDQPRDCCDNKRELERANKLAEAIRRERAADYERLNERLGQVEAKVTDTFWLIRAVQAQMPLAGVEKLAQDEEVLYIEPDNTDDAPPQRDVVDGRRNIVSDPYFNLGLTAGWIGLLDTGVRRTHVAFNSPSHIDFMRDCVNGAADCNTGSALNPDDDCWNHGTSSAAIITGNARQGNAFRGVTGITLDSWKVYPSSVDRFGTCDGGLNTTATIRGFENAVRVLDLVIVAEMQGSGDERSAIAMAANSAFDAGAVVIAANGNNGPASRTVNVPANAHRAIGVGDFDVRSGAQVVSQSRGPAPDGRFKPDIQAPTHTETASNSSDTARRIFGGTSGATPYAAGAAALLRNWLRGPTGSIDPGQVYAQMILSGQNPFPFTNIVGAGPLELPTNGFAWWGKVTVNERDNVDIPIVINAENANTFDAALWWPEGGVRIFGFHLNFHSDFDLHLIDPSGSTRASSVSSVSVFERARVGGRIANGVWKLRIRGFEVPLESPTVYWAAHVRTR